MLRRATTLLCVAIAALAVAATDAHASLLGLPVGVNISFLEGGPHVSGSTTPFNSTVVVGSGLEISSLAIDDTYLSGGYNQRMYGTVSLDISADSITASFSGQAQPYGIYFTITGLPTITNAVMTAHSTNQPPGVVYFYDPTFTSSSVTLFLGFLGFQPGLTMSETVKVTEKPTTAPVPEPASLTLLGLGLAFGAKKFRRARA
jgi:hypothetical protein